MNKVLTNYTIVDKETEDKLFSHPLATREQARQAKRSLSEKGFKARIRKDVYVLQSSMNIR